MAIAHKSILDGSCDVQGLTDAEWDRIWLCSPEATFFHSRIWVRIWEKYSRGKLRATPLLLRLRDGTMAVAPQLARTRFPNRWRSRWQSSAGGTYGGWFSPGPVSEANAIRLWRALFVHNVPLVVRANPFDAVQCRAVEQSDLFRQAASPIVRIRRREDQTLAVRLGDEPQELWRSWRKGHRSAVTKARREGVSTRVASSMEDWREYYAVYEQTLERWGERATSRYSWHLFELLYSSRSPYIRLWLAEHGGAVVAGALCLYSRNAVSYWHGAARRDAQELRPVHLLMYDAMADACERKLSWFDFNPSGGHSGVEAFKLGFRPDRLACPVLETEWWWSRPARAVRDAWRGVVQR